MNLLIVGPMNSCNFQFMYYLPFVELKDEGLRFRFCPEEKLNRADLEDIDCLIIYRCFQGNTLSLVRLAHKKGTAVIYELDDDLFETPEEEWGQRYRGQKFPYVLEMFLAEADGVKAGSPELAARLMQKGFRAFFHPYAVQLMDVNQADYVPPFKVGYFGTSSHRRDIETIFPALMELQSYYGKNIEFEFINCYPKEWPLLRQVRILPCQADYRTFVEYLSERQWHLGLAPLIPDRFNKARSDGKFRDYSAVGIPGVYADLEPYRASVVHQKNGWLCNMNPETWFNGIKDTLSYPRPRELIEAARERLKSTNSPAIVASNWLKLLKNLTRKDKAV